MASLQYARCCGVNFQSAALQEMWFFYAVPCNLFLKDKGQTVTHKRGIARHSKTFSQ